MTDAAGRLTARIAGEIERDGPVPFARFMELALYAPKLGYYTGSRTKIGREGDFYTSLDVHPVFGQLIGAQVIEMAEQLAAKAPDAPFTVVEMGAGKGLLAHDILRTVRAAAPELFARLHYIIVDISPDLIARQRKLLADFSGHIEWREKLGQVGDVTGVFLSNELVDSLPHHQVVMENGTLREVFVTTGKEGFCEVLKAPSTPALSDYFERMGMTLPDGYRTEVNLAAAAWMKAVAGRLKKGWVMTIDYGYPAEVYYAPERKTGTFLCYHEHKPSENPYARVGRQDMTAHVDFSSLARAGEAAGLSAAAFTDQGRFLVGLGIARLMERVLERDGGDPEKSDEFAAMRKLMDPHGMGRVFKVLLQQKGMGDTLLSGFRFPAFSTAALVG